MILHPWAMRTWIPVRQWEPLTQASKILKAVSINERLPCTCVLGHFSHIWFFATPWTVAHQAPLSLGFSQQEYWSGLPCPPPGDLHNPGTELMPPASPALQADFLYWEAWEVSLEHFILVLTDTPMPPAAGSGGRRVQAAHTSSPSTIKPGGYGREALLFHHLKAGAEYPPQEDSCNTFSYLAVRGQLLPSCHTHWETGLHNPNHLPPHPRLSFATFRDLTLIRHLFSQMSLTVTPTLVPPVF